MHNILDILNLTKSFKNFTLKDLSFTLPKATSWASLAPMAPAKPPPLS